MHLLGVLRIEKLKEASVLGVPLTTVAFDAADRAATTE